MKVFNTLSGRKEEFSPPGDEVRMYVCGVTPYDSAHIGHAMSYIIFDVIRRYLQFRGYRVKHVQNITDIDDKIIDRAARLGVSTSELAGKYTDSYLADMDALNIRRADVYPRATGEIPKIIEVVQGLVDKGYAYPAQGSVYFRVRNVSDYGKLGHRNLESMMAGARVESGEEKEHPMDFVLWKASKPGEPSWDSPWGPGRPGWHIECSAMSLKYLGDSLDIHGGGQDLIFPHHENEIAQSESFTGKKPFVKHWLHNGLLQLGEEKMSKSLGNLITIRETLEKHSADALRIFVLSSHYRSPLTYSEEALEAAERGAERLRQAARGKGKDSKTASILDAGTYRIRFTEVMDEDFNTPQAIAAVFDLARDINRASDEGTGTGKARETLKELAGVLGLTLKLSEEQTLEAEIYNKAQTLEDYVYQNFEEAIKPIQTSLPQLDKNESVRRSLLELFEDLRNQFAHGAPSSLDKAETSTREYINDLDSLRNQLAHSSGPQDFVKIQDILKAVSDSAVASIGSYSDFRQQLREDRHFELADKIRDRLDEMGIALEDTPEGTVWKRKR